MKLFRLRKRTSEKDGRDELFISSLPALTRVRLSLFVSRCRSYLTVERRECPIVSTRSNRREGSSWHFEESRPEDCRERLRYSSRNHVSHNRTRRRHWSGYLERNRRSRKTLWKEMFVYRHSSFSLGSDQYFMFVCECNLMMPTHALSIGNTSSCLSLSYFFLVVYFSYVLIRDIER